MHNYKKQLQSLFSQFAMTIDMPTKSFFNKTTKEYAEDFIKLDYNRVYGGYRLDIVHKNTGESFFVFSSRMSTKEMIAFLQGYITAKQSNE